MADNEGCGEIARVSNHAIRRLIKDGVLAAGQVVPDAPHKAGGTCLVLRNWVGKVHAL